SSPCRITQNSYQLMLDRLGAWPGGPKPDPFGCTVFSSPRRPFRLTLFPYTTLFRSVEVSASDDCSGIDHVHLSVAPLGLESDDAVSPYTWDLTMVNGMQTLTATLYDVSGKTTTVSMTVHAPGLDAAVDPVVDPVVDP